MKTQQELSEQLEAQSRAAIKAWCDDPSVQLEYTDKSDPHEKWFALVENSFYLDSYHYRIAKMKELQSEVKK